jgi:uncharacterized C2H2 Zn-finger protein
MYQCPICDHLAYSVVDCKAHFASAHPEQDEVECGRVEFRCPQCGALFKHNTDCKNHAKRAHGLLKPDCQPKSVPN